MPLLLRWSLTQMLNIHYPSIKSVCQESNFLERGRHEKASFSMFIKYLLCASFCESLLTIPLEPTRPL